MHRRILSLLLASSVLALSTAAFAADATKPEDFVGGSITLYVGKKKTSFLDLPPIREQMQRLLGPDARKDWDDYFHNGVARDGTWIVAWGASKADTETYNSSIFYDPAGRFLSCDTREVESKEPLLEIRNGTAYPTKAFSARRPAKVVLRGTDRTPVEFEIESFNCPGTFEDFEQAYKGTKRQTFKW